MPKPSRAGDSPSRMSAVAPERPVPRPDGKRETRKRKLDQPGHRPLRAQRREGALALGGGPQPERLVREVDRVDSENPCDFHVGRTSVGARQNFARAARSVLRDGARKRERESVPALRAVAPARIDRFRANARERAKESFDDRVERVAPDDPRHGAPIRRRRRSCRTSRSSSTATSRPTTILRKMYAAFGMNEMARARFHKQIERRSRALRGRRKAVAAEAIPPPAPTRRRQP